VIRAWRIVKSQHAASAFSGDGARLFGGRWTSLGIAAVYTSESAALATLEVLVHTRRMSRLQSYVAIRCEFDEKLVTDASDLPENWRESPAPPELQEIGDDWVRSARSAVLRVPSVIVPGENNYLLNPAHPKFKKIAIGKPERFVLDTRLVK
jgi:RES domain-containing protein